MQFRDKLTRGLGKKIVFVIPVCIYAYAITRFSINIPHYDDYVLILDFLNQYKNTHSFTGALSLIFSQVFEYRIAFAKSAALIDYYINGHLSFVRLIYLGNIAWFFVFVLLYKASGIKREFKLAALLPVPFLFFHLQYWESSTWAIIALDQLSVFFFSLYCIYLLNQNTWASLLAAMIPASIAPYTSPNGLFVLIIGFVYLVIRKERDCRSTFIWCLFSVILYTLYFANYIPQASSWHNSGFLEYKMHPMSFIINYFALLGASAGFGFEYLSIISGFCMFLWICWLQYRKYYNANPVIYFFIIFLLGTLFATLVSRAGYGTELYLYTSRYRIGSSLLLVCLYISWMDLLNGPAAIKWAKRVLPFAVIFLVLSWALYLPFMSGRYEELRTGVNGLTNANHLHAYKTILEASKNNIYHLPKGYLDKIAPDYKRDEKTKFRNFTERFNARDCKDTTLTFRINLPGNDPFNSKLNILLQKQGVIYLFNSGLTPTTVREVLHQIDPDNYKSELILKNEVCK